MASSSSQETNTVSIPSLSRGQACITCRRKKMRCDGVRPFCGPCSLTKHPDHCEYTDKQGRTFTEVLEERLRILKARIKELEERKDDAPVLLSHPYPQREYRPGHKESLQQLNSPARLSEGSELGASLYQNPPAEVEANATQILDVSGLIQTFLPRAHRLYFALHVPTFLHDLARPVEDPLRPHETLTSAIALWALRIMSVNAEYDVHEFHLLKMIRDCVATGHASTIGRHRIQAIQAELLTALYLFNGGRIMEGRYHLAAAGTGVLACGLHRIAAPQEQPVSPVSSSWLSAAGIQQLTLDQPKDAIELGERLNLFWSVYTLDRHWSVALGCTPAIPDYPTPGAIIRAPLPTPLDNCNSLSVDEILNSAELSVRAFLDGSAEFSILEDPSSSVVALVVASAFFEGATRTAAGQLAQGKWHLKAVFSSFLIDASTGNGVSHHTVESFGRSIAKFNHVLEGVPEGSRAVSQPLLQDKGTEGDEHTRVLARTLGYGAIIQLLYPFMGNVEASKQCRSAVREIVRIIRSDPDLSLGLFDKVDFFLGIVWISCVRVIANELAELSSQTTPPRSLSPTAISGQTNPDSVATEAQRKLAGMLRAQEIAADLETLLNAIRRLGETCPLIASQLEMLEGSTSE